VETHIHQMHLLRLPGVKIDLISSLKDQTARYIINGGMAQHGVNGKISVEPHIYQDLPRQYPGEKTGLMSLDWVPIVL